MRGEERKKVREDTNRCDEMGRKDAIVVIHYAEERDIGEGNDGLRFRSNDKIICH